MPQKYYNSSEAAEVLGVSTDDIREMIDRREIHGYRDGADWKFKAEDIERVARERGSGEAFTPSHPSDSSEMGDVLLSEAELGGSDPSGSGTVIGMHGEGEAGFGESDLVLAGSDIGPAAATPDKAAPKSPDELDMTLDEGFSLEEGGALGSSPTSPVSGADSAVDIAGSDDDIVLGGSGSGSDITLGGDSGISLVDPADSGISLEDPLDLSHGTEESLELGEDDLLTLAEASATGMKTDDDFLLTPMEEAGDEEDSESGSQVIALDAESDESATVVAPSGRGMAAMLEEDVSAAPRMGAGAQMGFGGAAVTGQQPVVVGGPMVETTYLPETPYTAMNITALVFCLLFLLLGAMFTYDLMRNMWSWDGAYTVNSSLMDTILGWFGG